ncbi:MAG: hypothetical protein HC769_12800 [Cyanobacteria bacterium CRU_2_1]|nr:hypothetical protein [Cyanobacteria bacterium CRU_2_1]
MMEKNCSTVVSTVTQAVRRQARGLRYRSLNGTEQFFSTLTKGHYLLLVLEYLGITLAAPCDGHG